MPTLSCLEEPPCIQVLPTECRRKSPPLLHPPSRLRSLLHQRGSTLYGLEDPSLLHSPPSRLCGYPSRNMMSPAQELFTANVSKSTCYLLLTVHLLQLSHVVNVMLKCVLYKYVK